MTYTSKHESNSPTVDHPRQSEGCRPTWRSAFAAGWERRLAMPPVQTAQGSAPFQRPARRDGFRCSRVTCRHAACLDSPYARPTSRTSFSATSSARACTGTRVTESCARRSLQAGRGLPIGSGPLRDLRLSGAGSPETHASRDNGQLSRDASWAATRRAQTMTVSIGLTPSDVGKMLESATYRPGRSCASPDAATTPRRASASIRAVPIG